MRCWFCSFSSCYLSKESQLPCTARWPQTQRGQPPREPRELRAAFSEWLTTNRNRRTRGSCAAVSSLPRMKLIPGSGRFAGSSFAPLVPGLWEHPYLVRDFTRGLEGQAPLSETGHGYDVGRYNERRRSMYTSELFGGTPASPTYTLPQSAITSFFSVYVLLVKGRGRCVCSSSFLPHKAQPRFLFEWLS